MSNNRRPLPQHPMSPDRQVGNEPQAVISHPVNRQSIADLDALDRDSWLNQISSTAGLILTTQEERFSEPAIDRNSQLDPTLSAVSRAPPFVAESLTSPWERRYGNQGFDPPSRESSPAPSYHTIAEQGTAVQNPETYVDHLSADDIAAIISPIPPATNDAEFTDSSENLWESLSRARGSGEQSDSSDFEESSAPASPAGEASSDESDIAVLAYDESSSSAETTDGSESESEAGAISAIVPLFPDVPVVPADTVSTVHSAYPPFLPSSLSHRQPHTAHNVPTPSAVLPPQLQLDTGPAFRNSTIQLAVSSLGQATDAEESQGVDNIGNREESGIADNRLGYTVPRMLFSSTQIRLKATLCQWLGPVSLANFAAALSRAAPQTLGPCPAFIQAQPLEHQLQEVAYILRSPNRAEPPLPPLCRWLPQGLRIVPVILVTGPVTAKLRYSSSLSGHLSQAFAQTAPETST
ncbi:hypothetical protein FA15DRAFT_700881 [Coprinopsis marcescibilis]|uniref:Uncharacterized protein n=1 Tax=Coprinopsis marcescibilis TaxID=230819 RepID=A0A5C3L6L8_COPMA|nr:hypothetical protein FA15DRAFT_700881 [Coprinopsis marcescibilis]